MIATLSNEHQIIFYSGLLILVLVTTLFIFVKLKNRYSVVYNPRTFLTNNEKDCFKHLSKEFPDYHICPQVSMGALLAPNTQQANGSEYTILRNKIQSKVVDFVMMNKDLEVSFIIELDDKSHDNKVEQDNLRDSHFLKAGIPTARFRRQGNKFPNRAEIESQLLKKRK